MKRWFVFLLLIALAPVSLQAAEPGTAAHPEAKPFAETTDATAAVDAALSRAKLNGKRVIIVMGANWCHDSRALASWFETPRFAEMLEERYEVVFVDAGTPQRKGQARNQHLIKRFGGQRQKNTPYVMFLSPIGKLLNRKDARSWRNAASRSEEEVYTLFASFIPG